VLLEARYPNTLCRRSWFRLSQNGERPVLIVVEWMGHAQWYRARWELGFEEFSEPIFPIPGSSASVCNCHNLNGRFLFAIDHRIRKALQDKPARALIALRPSFWSRRFGSAPDTS
jgi:hypothetical protein